jgi:hypothetical protein
MKHFLKKFIGSLRSGLVAIGGSDWLLQKGWLGLHETRRLVASRYLYGQGVEIGALGFPLLLPTGVSVIYVDKIAREQSDVIYPSASDKAHVNPDRVEDGFSLPSFKPEVMDFVVGNHVLEHAPDFFGALARWIDVTRVGGHVFATLTIASECFDRKRGVTEPSHFLADYQAIVGGNLAEFEESTVQHCRDYLTLACPEILREAGQPVPYYDPIQIERRSREMFARREDLHYHTYSYESLKYALVLFADCVRRNVVIETVARSRIEIVFVLRKLKPLG